MEPDMTWNGIVRTRSLNPMVLERLPETSMPQEQISQSESKTAISGALDGGVPMSRVKLKKRQCRMSMSLGK